MTLRTGYFKRYITALKFYNSIDKKELNKYKLVNEGFIIKYIDKNISVYIGEFHKGRSVFNDTRINAIQLSKNENPQRFKKDKRIILTHTRMDIQNKYPSINFWKKLHIDFKEKPIEFILFNYENTQN